MHSAIRIAVDIGGTFTDIEILETGSGRVHQFKTPSTPADPSIGLLGGITAAAARFGFDIADVEHVLHGTTIATNAVLQRKLPPAGLITTAGFEDVLQIGRHGRRDVYAITADPVPALVPRRLSLGVTERMAHDGRVLTALDEASVEAAAATLKAANVKSVAVCLLHTYANPAHERRIGALLAELLPDITVSLSSDLSPEIREYERMSTTVLNAMLMPIVQRYTTRLADRLATEAPDTQVYLVQSNGGVSGLAKAGREPARLLLSGPAGGAAAAKRLAAALDEPNLVAVDMGGTSFDISIVAGGAVAMVNEGDVDGLPVRLPMVEMRTIGAGGGSIAWVDEAGRLRIGPQSAGAEPGPACYGRGGSDLTVTDANLLLGRLDGSSFMGGAMPLDRARAEAAGDRVAVRLGLDTHATAAGVIAVTNSNLATAIRLSLFEKGLDPQDFSLLSFGGAGGVHACEVAEDLGIAKVIFPAHASTLSAWGILWSDIVHDLAATEIGMLVASGASLAASAARLAQEASRLLDEDNVPETARAFNWSLDLRYAGQAFDLNVPLTAAEFAGDALVEARVAFDRLHRQRFSYDEPAVAVEVVALRLSAVGGMAKPMSEGDAAAPDVGPPTTRLVWARDGFVTTTIAPRDGLGRAPITGPAVIEEVYTSSYIPRGWTAELLSSGALVAIKTVE